MPTRHEVDRLLGTYARRAAVATWAPHNAGNQAILRERGRVSARLLRRHGLVPPRGRILEVGCGHGHALAALRGLGARSGQLFGVDLLHDRLEEARRRQPELHWQRGNAEQLPFRDESFTLVMLFTVFSSILDPEMERNVAREVVRVLRPGGAVLWYDFRYPSPNPEVRAMSRAAIRRVFPDLALRVRSVTVLPPLVRRLGRATHLLYPLLARLPLLRTHYVGLLTKRSPSA
jgi:ubiquinone/menaquinone biosynthesis C-methylase UbiE